MEIETAAYYELSTIAQTLAAAVALLGGFALFALQQSAAELDELSKAATRAHPGLNNEESLLAIARKQYDEVLKRLSTPMPEKVSDASLHHWRSASVVGSIDRLRGSLETMKRTRLALRRALAISGLTILGSVLTIPLVPVLGTLLCPAMAINAVLFVVSLLLCSHLMVSAVN